jgi:hypothetical protein
VTKDISDDCNSIAVTSNTISYKLAKADNVIALYVSNVGKNCKVTFSNIRYQEIKISDPYSGQ